MIQEAQRRRVVWQRRRVVWQSSRQVQRCLLSLGYSGLGQVASNAAALVFVWWVFLVRLSRAGWHGRAYVVLGALTRRQVFFPSFPCAWTSQMLRVAGFVSKSLSLERVKAWA